MWSFHVKFSFIITPRNLELLEIMKKNGKYDHVTPLLKDQLHWLRVPQRVQYKCCLLVYKAMNGLAPTYISNYCTRVTGAERRSSLRSTSHNNLIVPRSKTLFGDRSFSVAGPRAWNSLPDNVKTSPSIDTFKKRQNSFVSRVVQLTFILWSALDFGSVHAYGAESACTVLFYA